MPSPVLNWETLYYIIFSNKPLFRNFFDYSQVHKGYRCYCHNLHRYLVYSNVTFLKHEPFSSPLTHTSQGEEDDLLVYTMTSPIVSPELAHVPTIVV